MDISSEWAWSCQEVFEWGSLFQLTLTAVLGEIVGAERELTGHTASLRTNTLIGNTQ